MDEGTLSQLPLTRRAVARRAQERGWLVKAFTQTPNALLALKMPDWQDYVYTCGSYPPQTSFAMGRLVSDKVITNQLLSDHDINVPKEFVLGKDQSTLIAMPFISELKRVVVKPLDAAHGNGISVLSEGATQDEALLERAIAKARLASHSGVIILQEYIEGEDIRIVCIGYKAMAAITRVPARVVGDGKLTVRELIENINNSDERGEAYSAKYNVIPFDEAEEFLGAAALERTPEVGENVQVIGVSNVGKGGERVEANESLPDFLKEKAEKVSRILQLPVCGVDFIVSKKPVLADTESTLKHAVIEVNASPTLIMYDDLESPEQVALIDAFLDVVASSKH